MTMLVQVVWLDTKLIFVIDGALAFGRVFALDYLGLVIGKAEYNLGQEFM